MKTVRLTLAVLALLSPATARAGDRGWDRASGIARDVLIGAAFGVPAVQGDWQGDLQAAGSMAAAGGGTFILKALVHERRPDGSDDRGFPSGHTSVAFAAASNLELRYGWHAGLPAFVVAGFVGVARVEASKHYTHDVIAGAAIGMIGGALCTSRHDDRVRLAPWSARGGGGVDVAMRF